MKKETKDKVISSLGWVYENNLDIDNNTVYLMPWHDYHIEEEWGVGQHSVTNAIKGLDTLERISPENDVTLKGFSYGGSWYDGIALYDRIKRVKTETTILMDGYCMSMGTIVLQAANIRVLGKSARVMLHYGDSWYDGHSKNFISWGDEEKRVGAEMEDIYLKGIRKNHPKFTRKELHDMIIVDKLMSAQEAVKLGLADKVI